VQKQLAESLVVNLRVNLSLWAIQHQWHMKLEGSQQVAFSRTSEEINHRRAGKNTTSFNVISRLSKVIKLHKIPDRLLHL
jgi:hypothetical protein